MVRGAHAAAVHHVDLRHVRHVDDGEQRVDVDVGLGLPAGEGVLHDHRAVHRHAQASRRLPVGVRLGLAPQAQRIGKRIRFSETTADGYMYGGLLGTRVAVWLNEQGIRLAEVRVVPDVEDARDIAAYLSTLRDAR
mgnify:CR=1 FL=1